MENKIIICKDSPEWGTWRILHDDKEMEWFTIRGNRGEKVLSYYEFNKFWEIVK